MGKILFVVFWLLLAAVLAGPTGSSASGALFGLVVFFLLAGGACLVFKK